MQGGERIPEPTLARLATYYRLLKEAAQSGAKFVNSAKIEELSGISAAQVRKDISRFGEFGTPGVGYETTALIEVVASVLKIDRVQRVAIVGAGRLGQALAAYPGLAEYNFRIAAIFDVDPNIIGKQVGGLVIEDASNLSARLKRLGASIVALAVPAANAQEAAAQIAAAGACLILNFAPAHLRVPAGCIVRNVSLTQEFAVLAYYSGD